MAHRMCVREISFFAPPPPPQPVQQANGSHLYFTVVLSHLAMAGISPVAPGARALTVAGAHPRGLAGNASPPLATTASCFGIVEILSVVGVQQDPRFKHCSQ